MTQSGGDRDGEASGLELEDRCASLMTMLGVVQRAVFATLIELQRREWWRQDGARSMAAWVVTRYGISPHLAHEWLRIAHALESMPALDAAYCDGHLSYEQLAFATRIATAAGDDTAIAERAVALSVAELRRLAQLAERVDPDTRDEAHRRRSFDIRWDHHRHGAHLRGFLPNDSAALVEKALQARVDRMDVDPDTGTYAPYRSQMADALTQLCSQSLAADGDADRATIVVNTDIELLTRDDGIAELPAGHTIDAQTARRLACDCRLQLVATTDGNPVAVGTTTHNVPPWLRRLLAHRDGGCRFPGCDHTRWTHAHHIQHWAHGGPTTLANLLTLCPTHHRLVHEGHWTVELAADTTVTFIRPDGRPYRPRSPDPP